MGFGCPPSSAVHEEQGDEAGRRLSRCALKKIDVFRSAASWKPSPFSAFFNAWHLRKDGLVSATSASESTSETSARSRQSRTRLRTALRELRSPSPPAASSHAPTLNSPLAGLCFAASHPQWRSERVHQKDRVMRWEQGEGVRGEGGLRAY